MARVDRLEAHSLTRPSVHEPVEAAYSVFTDRAGMRYLQIDTYGSVEREMPGKTSQAVQFGLGIRALGDILDELS